MEREKEELTLIRDVMIGKIKKVMKDEPTRCKSCNEGSAKERDKCEM